MPADQSDHLYSTAYHALRAMPRERAVNLMDEFAREHDIKFPADLCDPAIPNPEATGWMKPDGDHFYEVLVSVRDIADSTLDREYVVSRVAGCVGYAFRQFIRGEPCGEPENVVWTEDGNAVTFRFSYDTTKTASDDPDILEAFRQAKRYILEGTPPRKTMGYSRLVQGIGSCNVEFLVR